jgi:hypothetical protein
MRFFLQKLVFFCIFISVAKQGKRAKYFSGKNWKYSKSAYICAAKKRTVNVVLFIVICRCIIANCEAMMTA